MPTYRDVIIDVRQISGVGPDIPIGRGCSIDVAPFRRLHIEDGDLDYTLSIDPLSIPLDDGAPVTVKLPVTPVGQGLVAKEHGFKSARKRTVTVPAGVGPIAYEDLPDVLPGSLDPDADPEAAWWLEAANLQAQIDLIEVGSFYYEHIQTIPASEWIVAHNLGQTPNVAVLVGDEYVDTDCQLIDANTIRIAFPTPQAGKAVFS
jgi:hypothetical protein